MWVRKEREIQSGLEYIQRLYELCQEPKFKEDRICPIVWIIQIGKASSTFPLITD